jgi:hypothetical protein
MATYNITNANLTLLRSKLQDARTLLETRRPLWDKLSPEMKRRAVQKDAVLGEMWTVYKYLKDWFGGAE